MSMIMETIEEKEENELSHLDPVSVTEDVPKIEEEPAPVSEKSEDVENKEDSETKPVEELHIETPKLEHTPEVPVKVEETHQELPPAHFAYLIFTKENNGEMFIRWSDTPIVGAIAMFSTHNKVSPFKLKKPLDLQKNVSGGKKKFFDGIASFFKEADALDGKFQMIHGTESDMVDIWVSFGGKKWGKEPGVPHLVKDHEVIDMPSIQALAILPKSNAVYQGILKMDLGKFVNTAQREGAAWRRS